MARRRLNLSTPRDIRKAANRVANMLLNEELGAKAEQATKGEGIVDVLEASEELKNFLLCSQRDIKTL